jgi:hypothetical protein
MHHTRSHAALLITAAVLAAGCSSSESNTPTAFCSAIYTPAVRVVTVDSVTGAPLAGSATGTLQMAGVNDTLYHGSSAADSVLFGGTEPGTYQVIVSRTNYQPWVRSGIVVTPTGVCNEVNTVDMRARLQPAP